MADATYQPKVYRKQGSDELVVASGGTLTVESGGIVAVASGGKVTQAVVTKTAAYTVTAGDSGTTFLSGAVDLKFTLPSTAAGLKYTFVCHTVSTTTGLQIDPAAADAIMGNGLTSVDNKDLINTAATDAEGDSVTIVGDGVDGWWITDITGTWAKEA